MATGHAPRHSPYSKISAETSRDGPGELFLSVWSQRQDETNREHAEETERQDDTNTDHADETDRKMNPNNPWSRQKENIYIIHLINNIFKT